MLRVSHKTVIIVLGVPDRRQRGGLRICIRLGILGCNRSLIQLITMNRHLSYAAPVHHLASAFSALRFIWSTVEQAQVSKRQLDALAQSIAQLLQTLDGEYRAGRLLPVETSMPQADLCRFVGFTVL
jgi:hypothetical protein